jgi:hypothetical protein
MKLRAALVENLDFDTPPGTNGETEFHNVVRKMYPDANGISVPNSWTASQTQNYTIKGTVPEFVNKLNSDVMLVVWIQNDADKKIAQSAKSAYVKPSLGDEAAIVNCPAPILTCASGATGTINSSAVITNTGSTTLTNAKVFYKLDNGAWSSVNWTGTLAPGANATVTIPAISASVGAHIITDSVALPNSNVDKNPANNARTVNAVVTNTAGKALPLTNFESGFNSAGYIPYEPANQGYVWVNGFGNGLAHNGSSYMPWFKVASYPSGSVAYLIMPTPTVSGSATLEFYQAYAQTNASSNDKLEVVYSTNCGTSWTSLWSAQGAALATGPITANPGSWLPSPSATTSDWKLRSVSLNSLPANSLLAFRATAGGGNNLFIDDVNIRAGGLSVKPLATASSVAVYPNPARESATLEFSLSASSKVTVSVLDATGRTVSVVSDAQMQQGAQRLSIPTSTLAAGLYNITIRTEDGLMTQRLSVVK